MKKRKWIALLFLALIVALAGCGKSETTDKKQAEKTTILETPYKKTEFLMGTVVTLSIYDKGKEKVLDKGFDRVKDLADKIDVNDEKTRTSEVDKINAASGVKAVKVDDDIYYLIKEGLKFSAQTGGSKDITIGPITSLWHIGFPDARKPSQSEIDERLPLIGYKNVELNDQNKTVYLKKKGMELDLGGIAKGFIADEVKKVFKENGVTTAIIDLGGNILLEGESPKGKDWNVGIQDPFSPRNTILGKLPETDKSIVTSGIYERYLEVDGKKYHHLFDPTTGYPFDNDVAGVTIISKKSITGDGLSSAAFSKGIDEGLAFIEKHKGVEAIFVSKEKKVYITSGLKGKFELTSSEFKMGN
ncbi:FAD:protein FMN transferase [Listeria aquatica]|uniref:FAD:protein FMN transferase n=1 Tax=Listeria aquatica TaxID=1494960 RepID=A0A841ZRI5_9LIST|nr:FAD:protein FMN transferase [Listeria aquatica]MBC1522014.1 FAD:protein FMN transferase [Listeria aquatica]